MSSLDEEKRQFLMHLSEFPLKDPHYPFLMGFLLGRLPDVHLVTSLEGAANAVHLRLGPGTLWPHPWFSGWVGGSPLPHPTLFVAAMAQRAEPIVLKIEGLNLPQREAVAHLIFPDLASALTPPEVALKTRVEELRQRIDQALDIYRELQKKDPHKEDLEFFRKMAQEEIKRLSQELKELTSPD
ncbi:MAG: hypothetical protein QJR00_07570 [Bacillota bacterium]|nr:hypothetical protein [Bacillota bacterium]